MSEHHHSSEWAAARRKARPILAKQLPQPCIDCGRPVEPGSRWQVGHRVSVAVAKRKGWTVAEINALSNLGPTHARAQGQPACNQIAGGRLGKAIQTERIQQATRLLPW